MQFSATEQQVLQQKLERWCAASIRAISGNSSVAYRGHQLWVDEKPVAVQAPYLQLKLAYSDKNGDLDLEQLHNDNLRGIADGIAMRLRFSDRDIHKKLAPNDAIERLIFELLEQLRAESLAPENLIGIKSNLQRRFLFWANNTVNSRLTENHVGIMLFTVTVICWSRLQKLSIPLLIEDVIEATRYGLSSKIGHHVYALSRVRKDQAKFAEQALEIASIVRGMIDESIKNEDDQNESLDDSIQELIDKDESFLDWLSLDDQLLQETFAESEIENLVAQQAKQPYSVFSTEFDRERHILDAVRPAQLQKLRHQLDKRIRLESINTHRIARYLKTLISNKKRAGWSFREEEGHLDAARLSRLVTSPADHRLFRKEQQQAKSDCVVSILIDNSGSMTHHNEKIAALVDILSKALDIANIKTEVLGFTTGEWNGGKVAKKWRSAGKPENPGRLNSVLHTVYKSADTPWRRSRPAIAGMLKSDLFREGCDGEALIWAAKRLENRPESKKIIMLISDGSPMDTATLKANHESILDSHLAHVAMQIEKYSPIGLCALGVGLDLSTYISESLSISLSEQLSTSDYFTIAELLHRVA